MSFAYPTPKKQADLNAVQFRTSPTGKVYRLNARVEYVSLRKRRNLPDMFRLSDGDPYQDHVSKKRWAAAMKLFKYGRKGYKLAARHNNKLFLYSLDARMLGADPATAARLEDPANYYDEATKEKWQRYLDAAFPGAYAWGLHVGENGRVHPHVITGGWHNVPNPPTDDPEWRKRIDNTPADYAGALAYIWPKVPPTPENVKIYQRAVKAAGGADYLTQLSGFTGVESRKVIRKSRRKTLTDGTNKKESYLNGGANTSCPVTPESFERWLSEAFGTFDRHDSPPQPSLYPPPRPSPEPPGPYRDGEDYRSWYERLLYYETALRA